MKKQGRIPPYVAIAVIAIAIALALWQFAFRKDDSFSFSTRDLPAGMKTDQPPAQVSGTIPRRSPQGSPSDFTGPGVRIGNNSTQGPPGRR